jgi:hypothetical protein
MLAIYGELWLTEGAFGLRIFAALINDKEKDVKLKGVILARGTGFRLKLLIKSTNKHLPPIGHQTMFYYQI